jgi:collagenase-like PrtC family protease
MNEGIKSGDSDDLGVVQNQGLYRASSAGARNSRPSLSCQGYQPPMKLTVPANYDLELVPALAQYPVSEVYGKLPGDLVGGGRPSYMGTPLTKTDLGRYAAALQQQGIAFNYLLNSSCHGNREWTRSWQKRFMRLLDTLGNLGIRHVTVSTPFLLEAIKARRPEFTVKVGIYAQVDTPRRAKFWEDLGADAINLESFSINRDFRRLAAIRAAVRCDLQLIANHCCLPNCPLQSYHQNGFAHSSDGSRTLFIDYCFLRCSQLRLEDPSLFIKSAWIRPEDLSRYEALGYTTFKLIERGIPSAELLKRVAAYSARRFEGNLAELLLPYCFEQPVRRSRFWILRYFFKPFQLAPHKLWRLLELVRSQGMLFPQQRLPIQIQAAQIPGGFLDAFEDRDCAATDCGSCGYCETISRQAVRIEPEFHRKSLEQFRAVRSAMTTGRLW